MVFEHLWQWYSTLPAWERIPVEFLFKQEAAIVAKPFLEKLSVPLLRAFQNALDQNEPAAFAKAIEDEGKKEEVARLVERLMLKSIVVPNMPENNARPEHISQLFASFLRATLALSRNMNMDIVLPGSFLGENAVQIVYSEKLDAEVDFTTDNVEVRLSPPQTNYLPMEIVPTNNPTAKCVKFLEAVDEIRRDRGPSVYVGVHEHSNQNYQIKTLTAGKANYISINKQDNIELIGGSNHVVSVKASNYAAGINSMTAFLPNLNAVGVLPAAETAILRGLANNE